MTGRITLAGEWHPSEETATSDKAAKVVALNENIPTLKPLPDRCSRDNRKFPAIDGVSFDPAVQKFLTPSALNRGRPVVVPRGSESEVPWAAASLKYRWDYNASVVRSAASTSLIPARAPMTLSISES